MLTLRLSGAAACALFAMLPAQAITIVAGADPALLNRGYNSTFDGVNLSGVVEVLSNQAGCSGSLLSDGVSILTAGHCVNSAYGSQLFANLSVQFLGPDGFISAAVTTVSVDPSWTGTGSDGGDLAVLHLASDAPAFATRYSLFSGTPNIGATVNILAGYGYGGSGAAGYNGSLYPFGTLRAGTNRYAASGAFAGESSTLLLGQSYNTGDVTTNVLRSVNPYSAPDAAAVAPGDSGGPTFQNGLLVGVHDSIDCFLKYANSNICDSPHPGIDSSFGQFFADTSVSANITWITGQETATAAPEPGTMVLVVFCMTLLTAWQGRTSRTLAKAKNLAPRRILPALDQA